MKTIYLIKSISPFIFLPLAPGVLQLELMRQGLLTYGYTAIFAVLVQVVVTLAVIAWVAHRAVKKANQSPKQAFLKMSCVSKKVFHSGQWMSFEQYLADHHNVVVSHGMTPEEAQTWLQDAEAFLQREAKPYRKNEVAVSQVAS